ncbi:hypothetical protein D9611_000650 [Ephemerocybe angulata]|uniref:Uncharacterized protein n=1 Tax=Ephemerocybe angulata TaxID=980116 RepID=A0A8H5BN33_9AGAR|nr:hypothetical protein D9611_000650 [Tulosesus angulatus]
MPTTLLGEYTCSTCTPKHRASISVGCYFAKTIRATLLREEGIVRSYPAAWNVCWRWTPKPKVAPLSLPYDGYVVARFELRKGSTSDADRPSQEEEVKLVLRILKLLDPVAPDGSTYELPEGGDLAQSLARDGRRYWSSPMDTARRFINPSSMKILEDLYLGEGATAPAEG